MLNSNSASEHARDMVLAAKPMFWGMRNHLGPFSEPSHKPEGQEQGGRAVGGQVGLQEVNFTLGSNSASEHARDMVLVLGHGESFGTFSEASDQPEGQELAGGAVRGQEGLQEVKFILEE